MKCLLKLQKMIKVKKMSKDEEEYLQGLMERGASTPWEADFLLRHGKWDGTYAG